MSFGSGMFNMDTPWLYIYTSHKLSQQQRHTLQLTSELTASKWLTIRNLILEAFYRDRGREREARLELYTPSVIYLQVRPEKATASKSSEYHNLVFGLVKYFLFFLFAHALYPTNSLSRQEGGAQWGSEM